MKKYLILNLLCLISANVFCQNVFDRKVNFEYIKLPVEPINKSLKNYQSYVVPEYEAEVKARKDAFNKSVQDAEGKYITDVADYDKNVKAAGVRYAEEMVVYKVNKRVQPNLAEPILILPVKPEKVTLVDNNYYPKNINAEALSSTYLILEGYKKGSENAIQIKALLKGFENKEPELKVSEVSKKTKEGTPYTEKEYYYEMLYRHPMGLKVHLPDGAIIFYEYFEDLNRYSVYKTQKYKTEAELMQSFNKMAVLNNLEDKIIGENLQYVNNVLNNRFGFRKVKAQEEIFLVDGKKYSYTDYQQAFEAAMLGFNQLSADLNRTVAAQNLMAAVSIWETSLRESQPNNKKARINANVTTATLFNIALVSIYAFEFGKAEIYLNKILAMDSSKREQRRVEQIKSFLRDQQSRYDAYQKL